MSNNLNDNPRPKARAPGDTLPPQAFQRLASLVEERVGIRLPPTKRCLVESRLRRRIRALGLGSLRDYAAVLADEDRLQGEFPLLINALTVNKTDFFREPSHFSELVTRALPDLMSRDGVGRHRPLQVWSAACSTGPEPYTLAMVLSDFAETVREFRFSILGLDIDTDALVAARRAVYALDMIEPIPEDTRRRYLLKARDPRNRTFRIAPELRRQVRFRPINLLTPTWVPEDRADVIFCRNVLIYFERPNQQKVLDGLISRLRPGGYLFVGHSETLHGLSLPVRSVATATYQRHLTD